MLVLVAFPLLLLLAFSRAPRSKVEEVDPIIAAVSSGAATGQVAQSLLEANVGHLPHLPAKAGDMSLSEKASAAVWGTPKSVWDFRATDIGPVCESCLFESGGGKEVETERQRPRWKSSTPRPVHIAGACTCVRRVRGSVVCV